MLAKSYYLLKDHLLLPAKALETQAHLREAMNWLYRAQDATPDRGVSHSYVIGRGWMPSYPETSGYIIPTFLNWHALTGEEEARKRALDMADWEIGVQLPEGAIPGLVTGRPVVFDTGQVIFGWVSAYETSREPRYLDAALRAGDWLIEHLDSACTWKSFGNAGTSEIHTYNVRVAWALLELARISGKAVYRQPMEGFIEWVLDQEVNQGWFGYNCLNDNNRPLLHTIAYTAQGILEAGVILNDERCLAATRRTADALIPHIAADGRMPGRFDGNWHSAASWACLTGMAQMAIVWQRLLQLTGDAIYRGAADRTLDFLKRVQDMSAANPGVRGGIKGSYPINGEYGKFRLLNWAAKFYIDALLMEAYPDMTLPSY